MCNFVYSTHFPSPRGTTDDSHSFNLLGPACLVALSSFPGPTVRKFGGASDMAGSRNLVSSSKPWQPGEQYEFLAGSDPQEVARDTPNALLVGEHTDTSYPDTTQPDRYSDSTTSYTTPSPSRIPSPSPSPSHPTHRFTSSISDIDGEPTSPLLGSPGAYASIRDGDRRWWSLRPRSRRRRKREGRIWRTFKKGVRRIMRHPWFPQQPITIVRLFVSH